MTRLLSAEAAGLQPFWSFNDVGFRFEAPKKQRFWESFTSLSGVAINSYMKQCGKQLTFNE